MDLRTFIITVAVSFGMVRSQLWSQPTQVHLSYGVSPTEMVVTWVTQSPVNESLVEYGPLDLHFKVKEYHVGSSLGWSDLYSFVAMRTDSDWTPRFAVYGDMGNTNSRALNYIQQEAQKRSIDAILHIGDFAYDMNDDDGWVGDAFMQQIQPIAAYVPYMTCPGNHESAFNFSHYRNRFSMPGLPDNMFYSMPISKALIISINTEVFYAKEQPPETIATQYHWLEQTLQEANKPSNRAAQPWIIVVGHRPMYCSDDDGPVEHCNNPLNPVRLGPNGTTRQYSLEDLFYKYGVDLQFYAHEHSYERLWPVYNLRVCNGTKGPYVNPNAPVHIVTGSAGDKEGQTKFDKVLYDWSAFHTDDYGYTRLTVINNTHVYMDQVSSDKKGAVIDKMWLIKEKHGQGLYTCHKHSSLGDEHLNHFKFMDKQIAKPQQL